MPASPFPFLWSPVGWYSIRTWKKVGHWGNVYVGDRMAVASVSVPSPMVPLARFHGIPSAMVHSLGTPKLSNRISANICYVKSSLKVAVLKYEMVELWYV